MSETMKQVGATFAVLDGCADDLVQAMEGIGAASEKVASVIKVIDGLAFQTNILALNAAVEAARAGEAGLSFAVVADEVRHLARRSADAARDTAALIEESMQKSHGGQEKVLRVQTSIHAAAEVSARVQELVAAVNSGSGEQSQGLNQITQAIHQMESITQSTAASAEESASAAAELNAQSEALNDTVDRLAALIDGENAGGGRSTRPSPATGTHRALSSRPRGTVGLIPGPESEFPLD